MSVKSDLDRLVEKMKAAKTPKKKPAAQSKKASE